MEKSAIFSAISVNYIATFKWLEMCEKVHVSPKNLDNFRFKKGYVRHTIQGRSYIYNAVEESRSLAARAVRQIVDRLCGGSVEELVSGMVDAKVLTSGELKRLETFVRSRRQRGK